MLRLPGAGGGRGQLLVLSPKWLRLNRNLGTDLGNQLTLPRKTGVLGSFQMLD